MLLSVMGMYEYDPTLFDGLNVPEGIDKTDVVNNICTECAELEVLYPNFSIMKMCINVWSASEQYTWNKLYQTMTTEYNPIWNVDANITQTRELSRDRSGNNTNTDSVQGFNSNTWSDSDKNTGNYTDSEDTDETFTERRTGNIGVTATQDLLQKERDIAAFNLIEYITDSFKKRFCLMIY